MNCEFCKNESDNFLIFQSKKYCALQCFISYCFYFIDDDKIFNNMFSEFSESDLEKFIIPEIVSSR